MGVPGRKPPKVPKSYRIPVDVLKRIEAEKKKRRGWYESDVVEEALRRGLDAMEQERTKKN